LGLPESLAQPGWEDATTELVRPISKGCLGALWLGRISSRHGATRHVTLRELGRRETAPDLIEAGKLAASLKDPRLVRLLGVCSAAGTQYLASDPVRGQPAFELCRALRSADACVIQEVALRIALDTLYGLEGANDEFERVGAREPRRNLYPDTVWISGEGEVLLSELGVAELVAGLAEERAPTSWCPSKPSPARGSDDVFALGAFLYELLTSRTLADEDKALPTKLSSVDHRGGRLAAPLVQLVNRALQVDPAARFQNASEMARAIEALPMHWIASDRQVRSAVELLVRTSDHAEHDAGLASGEQALDPWEIPTRSLKMRLPP
jgi:serine/threonine protein kinase